MILTGRDLAEIGQLLHGPRWRRWLASKLGKTERTIIRYEDGETGIPRKVRLEILQLVKDQKRALEKYERDLSGHV